MGTPAGHYFLTWSWNVIKKYTGPSEPCDLDEYLPL